MTFGDEKDVVAFLKYPDTAVACDCGAAVKNRGHPRYFGSFPKILGHYVRDTGTITMEDAVRKMSALPAAIIGMVDRGHIAPGMRADVTLFDPKTVRDHATFDAPTLPSDGIRHVIVNGVPALADGAATGAKSGAVLLRDAHMPSRPMNSTAKARSFTASGQSADYTVSVAASQGAGERFAKGTVNLTDAKSGTVWTADSLGIVQTTKGWASVTAVLKDKAGNRKPATLTLDRADGGAETPVISLAFGNAPAAVLPAKGTVKAE
nr:amidohydrolase family protein [Sphingosinicella soli]